MYPDADQTSFSVEPRRLIKLTPFIQIPLFRSRFYQSSMRYRIGDKSTVQREFLFHHDLYVRRWSTPMILSHRYGSAVVRGPSSSELACNRADMHQFSIQASAMEGRNSRGSHKDDIGMSFLNRHDIDP